MKKFIDSIPFESDIKNEWLEKFEEEFKEKSRISNGSKEQSLEYLKKTNDKNMSDFIDDNQVSNSIYDDKIKSYEGDEDKKYEMTTWCFVGPHSDIPDTMESKRNSTGYNGPRYIAFYFFESNGHVLQSDFKRDDFEWKMDNLPGKEILINNKNILFLDIYETHALGYANNEHFNYIKNNKKHLIELYENSPERFATALSISYYQIPKKEEILKDFENIMQHMLNYAHQPKPF